MQAADGVNVWAYLELVVERSGLLTALGGPRPVTLLARLSIAFCCGATSRGTIGSKRSSCLMTQPNWPQAERQRELYCV